MQTDVVRGVLLDVGGVFLVPSRIRVQEALAELTSDCADADFDRAHYEGIRSIDVANVPGDQDQRIYLGGYLSALKCPDDRMDAAVESLLQVWTSLELWRQVVEGSAQGLRDLHDANLRLGIVSNSDGTVEEKLARNEICQVGTGRGVPVTSIIDSAVVGVSKPDSRIFDFALGPLGLHPSEVVYVGDSVKYDVQSSEAAGMMPLHFDPLNLCGQHEHSHIGHVSQVLDYR